MMQTYTLIIIYYYYLLKLRIGGERRAGRSAALKGDLGDLPQDKFEKLVSQMNFPSIWGHFFSQ